MPSQHFIGYILGKIFKKDGGNQSIGHAPCNLIDTFLDPLTIM